MHYEKLNKRNTKPWYHCGTVNEAYENPRTTSWPLKGHACNAWVFVRFIYGTAMVPYLDYTLVKFLIMHLRKKVGPPGRADLLGPSRPGTPWDNGQMDAFGLVGNWLLVTRAAFPLLTPRRSRCRRPWCSARTRFPPPRPPPPPPPQSTPHHPTPQSGP